MARWTIAATVFCSLSFVILYYAVLPALGCVTWDADLSTIKGDADRGEYVMRMAGCVACHTDIDNDPVPAITGSEAEIQNWTKDDIALYLQTGLKPDGDVSGGEMVDVIDESTGHMTDADVAAIAEYLLDPEPLSASR